MPGSRTDQILADWREVVKLATLPPNPPATGPRPGLGLAAVAVAAIVLALIIASRSSALGPGGAVSSLSPPPSESSATGTMPPTSAPESTAAVMPSPTSGSSDECSETQLLLGPATTTPGFGTFGTTLVFVDVSVRNAGPDCVLRQPSTILVATSDGLLQPVDVSNAGRTTTYVARHAQTFTAIVGAWWSSPGAPALSPCRAPIYDIVQVAIQLPSGNLRFALDRPWREVCSSPATTSLEYKG